MNLLFYSADSYFLNEFADYISRTQRDIQLTTYADINLAVEYLQQNSRRIDVVLADDYLFSNLTLSDKLKIVCSSKTRLSKVDDCFSLNIYQSGEDIIRDLKKLCIDIKEDNLAADRTENASLTIAFFSIQGGSGQSTIAYSLAAYLAQQHKTLLVSFDFVNAYQNLYPVDYPVDLAKMMFQIKDRASSVGEFYKAIVRNRHNIYVLPPFQSIGDIVELTFADVDFLLRQLKVLGEFDYIILDLNHSVDELNKLLLQQADKIVAVYTEDKIGCLKMEQYRRDPFITHWEIAEKSLFVSSKAVGDCTGQLAFPLVQTEAAKDLFSGFFENPVFNNSCMELQKRL